MAKHPKVFPPLMINMCRAGEVGGFLDAVLLQIAENYEAEVKLRGKVKSAMTYPVVVFCIAILAVIGMLLFIVPVFAKMFKTLGGKLPAPTQILVDISRRDEVPRCRCGIIVCDRRHRSCGARSSTSEEVRKVVDPLKLKVPVFGNAVPEDRDRPVRPQPRHDDLQSGVPILQSLDIVADTTGNMVLGQRRAGRAGQRAPG